MGLHALPPLGCINPHECWAHQTRWTAGLLPRAASDPDIASNATQKAGGRGGGNSALFGVAMPGDSTVQKTSEKIGLVVFKLLSCATTLRRGAGHRRRGAAG